MINKIAHFGDVHVFLTKRQDEIKKVFDDLIFTLGKEKPEIIYIGGDIVDSKQKLSAEQIELVKYLFYSCASIAPVIWILGNHDVNLRNKGLDSVSPLIDNLQTEHPIYFLKESGIYNLYDIDWAVWSIIDEKDPFKDLIKKNFTIGCHHGPVQGAKTDSDWKKFGSSLPIEAFNQCDNVFLNDIHKTQFFRDREIAYSGSLFQTKIDEDHNRGILIWDWNEELKVYEPTFKKVFNELGYKTYEINDLDNFDVEKIKFPTEKFIGRLLYTGDESFYSEIKFREIKKQLAAKIKNPILLKKRFSKLKVVEKKSEMLKSTDFFKEYFKQQGVNPALVKALKKLDSEYESKISIADYQTGEYFIEELEIHNFSCYGANNVVNFLDIQGLVGLFAPNKAGKSSLMHSIMFCLFNKTPKDSKSAISLINDQLEDGAEAFVQCKIRINGIRWRIKRRIVPKRDNSSASILVEVYEEVDGEEKGRHLESRPQTDTQILRPMLGDEKVFLTIILSSQKNAVEFVDKANAERLDLVIRFLGILIYDEKHSLVGEDLKKAEIRNTFLSEELNKLPSKDELQKKVDDLKAEIEKNTETLKTAKKTVEDKTIEAVAVKKEIEKLGLVQFVNESIDSLEEKLSSRRTSLLLEQKEEIKYKTRNEEFLKEFEKYKEYGNLESNQWTSKDITIAICGKETDVRNKEAEIKVKENQLNSEICPTCNQKWHTVDKDAINKDITALKLEVEEFVKQRNELKGKDSSISFVRSRFLTNKSNLADVTRSINALEIEIKETEEKIKVIKENEKIILKKKELSTSYDNLIDETTTARELQYSSGMDLERDKIDLKTSNESLKTYTEKYKEIQKRENLINNLRIYKKAMHRTGIPFMILNNFIPSINRELNLYLSELYDFTVEFQLEDNSLNVVYIYENLKKRKSRDVVQASGMEGTVINAAIRAALTKISLLPKPSLILLDEIFSLLDDEHLEKMKELLIKLKDNYQNIIIVSHLDELKDLPDHFIKLIQTDGITSIE